MEGDQGQLSPYLWDGSRCAKDMLHSSVGVAYASGYTCDDKIHFSGRFGDGGGQWAR